jgi:hypothetical protein
MTSEHARRLARVLAGAVVVLMVVGCAARPASDVPHQYLDETTAATVTVGSRALVFARERPELAVHARDYLTLVPIDVNRSGTHLQYFYGYLWSTIDKRGVAEGDLADPNFELIADGRRIPLTPVSGMPADVGVATPPLPAPARSAQVLLSPTDRDSQEFVTSADEVFAVAVRDGVGERYALWAR